MVIDGYNGYMIHVSVADAKTRLTELLRAAEAGERVVITRHGKPVAELAPPAAIPLNRFSLDVIAERQRARGVNPAKGWMSPDFDAPLPDEFWLGEEP